MHDETVLHFGVAAARPDYSDPAEVAGWTDPTRAKPFWLDTVDLDAVVTGSWAEWGADDFDMANADGTLHVAVTFPREFDADGEPKPISPAEVEEVADAVRAQMPPWSRLMDYCIESEGAWSEGQVLHALSGRPATRTWERTTPAAPEFACADCGTTTARTYAVTTLDYSDPIGTRTEVCLPRRMCGKRTAERAEVRDAFATVHASIVADLAADVAAGVADPEAERIARWTPYPGADLSTIEEIRETAEYDHAMDERHDDEDAARLAAAYAEQTESERLAAELGAAPL